MIGTMSPLAQTCPISPPIPMRSVMVKSKQPETHNSPRTLALEVRISARMMSQNGTGARIGEKMIRRRELRKGN